MLPGDEYLDGIATPTTFSAPIASTAMAVTIAESIPPETAIATFLKPVFFR